MSTCKLLAILLLTAGEARAQAPCGGDSAARTALLKAVAEFTASCGHVAVGKFNKLFSGGIPGVQPAVAEDAPVRSDELKLGEFSGAFSAWWAQRYDAMLSSSPAPGSAPLATPITAEVLTTISQGILERIVDCSITIDPDSKIGDSAAWTTRTQEGVVGGVMQINGSHLREAASGSRRLARDGSHLLLQERVTVNLVHETAHLFAAVLRYEYGAVPAWQPERLTTRFQKDAFWNGVNSCEVAGADYPACLAAAVHSWEGGSYYPQSAWGDEETARQVAMGIYNCSYGAVVGRILGVDP